MKNFSKKSRVFISLMLAFCILTIPAFAAITSAHSTFTSQVCAVDKCTYTASTGVYVDPDFYNSSGSVVGAIVQVYSADYPYSNIPAGYMGGQPRLYLNGSLLFAESWSYHNGIGNAFSTSYSTYFVSRSGIVYAQSYFGLYNGNGYDIYSTAQSPSLDVGNIYSSSSISIELTPEFEVNENGQTYGHGCFDNTPDLIQAIGVNDVQGYVYDSQLMSIGLKQSIDDVPEDIPSSIPLYDKDGITIIGTFLIGSPQE